jgi:hypothetical protein
LETSNKIFFEAIKESRDLYFVEYRPPNQGTRFAILQLVFPDPIKKGQIAQLMEKELTFWLARYDVPIVVCAFGETGQLIHLKPARDSDCLMGFLKDKRKGLYRFWGLIPDDELPSQALDTGYLKHIYEDVPYKTSEQLDKDIRQEYKKLRIGWSVFVIWLVILPVIIVILGFANIWIGIIVFAYSIYKAIVKALKLTGKLKPTPKEIKQREKEQKMRHYYYHCERNPEGFNRLKLENFEKDLKETIRKEAKTLKHKHSGIE